MTLANWHSRLPKRVIPRPIEGRQATEKTEVRILYTRHAVHFGISCHDSADHRDRIGREVSQESEGCFEILIDSNHDRRDAYVCQVNPLGTQSGGVIVEEQSNSGEIDFDSGWGGVWGSVWGLYFTRFI